MDRPRRPESSERSSAHGDSYSDARLNALIRAAHEVESFEADTTSQAPVLRLVGTPARAPARRVLANFRVPWRTVAAAAALIGLGFMIFAPRPSSAPKVIVRDEPSQRPARNRVDPLEAPRRLAQSEKPQEALPARYNPRPGDSAVILTIAQDADGRCRCVNSVPHQLAAGQTLGDLAASELLGVGLQRLCAASPERVLVLGMSGPRELLPSSKAEAERFASCLDRGPGDCDADATCFASSALACVSPSVNIVAETIAMRR